MIVFGGSLRLNCLDARKRRWRGNGSKGLFHRLRAPKAPGSQNQSLKETFMKVKSNVKAGGIRWNHNQTVAKKGLSVKSNVKAGGFKWNHNQKIVKKGLRVKSNVKAGGYKWNHNQRLTLDSRNKR